MANVKMSFIGLLDMLRFKNMKVQRDKIIDSTPVTALVENYASNLNAAARHPLSQTFTIEDIKVRGKGDVKTYTLRRTDGGNPAFFRAGQFVVIRQMIDGKLIARPVTLSCGPAIHDNWKVGDTVETSGPQGTFFYEPLRDAKKVVAIAGGSGITPVYAMANAIADGDEDFEMTVLYGSRTKKDILFQEEFDAIMARTDKVKLVNVLSEEEAEGCEHGFITAELIKKYAGDGTYSVFAAGSQGMYKFLDGEAEKLGLIKKYYRKELYDNIGKPWNYPGYPMEAKDKVFNLKIFEIPCNANENILVALERAGVAGPNRCRGGICGWCRSRLLSGEVFIPEDTDGRRAQDKLDGYIHPCASFAVSDLSIEMPLKR